MVIECINNESFNNLTLGKEYIVIQEEKDYYVVISDDNQEITCTKSRFKVVQDNRINQKIRATITELNYQLENDGKDIDQFKIRKNSKDEIKEILIKFKYKNQ